MKILKRMLSWVIFLAGLVVLLAVSSFVFAPKDNTQEFGMEETKANGILGEPENSIDVLVIGDSEAYSSISPLQIWNDTGYTSYISASSNQTLDYSYFLLQRALENQSPKMVILETNTIFREVPPRTALMTWVKKQFAVFRYHNRWKNLHWRDFTGQASYSWSDENKGYVFSRLVKASSIKNHMRPSQLQEKIPSLNTMYVQKIQELCKSRDIRLVLMSMPSTINWNYPKHNSVEQLAKELGCQYVDLNLMNDRLKIDWEKDTRDKGDHLNYFGAQKVTGYLSHFLQNSGLLSDHRKDPEFHMWDQALQKYRTLTSTAS